MDGVLTVGGKSLLDMVYPVGSIYLSYNHTAPETLFGGVWERIAGRFLLAAEAGDTIGTTGGEATHTLSLNELPPHHHTSMKRAESTDDYVKAGDRAWGIKAGSTADGVGYATSDTGGGAPHNNMPPYITVSVWRRTA